jgi:acetyl-CoA synthetase (ADP-forming)
MTDQQPKHRLSLREILCARSVAVIGASDDETKWGGRAFAILRKHTVCTEIYPVNPKADRVMGVKAYPSIDQCPGPVDIAMILVPASAIVHTVQACAQAGVGCAIVITAGFAESSEAGGELEQQMVQTAMQSGMRIIGPNCIGILNARANMLASTAVALPAIDRAPMGHIGFASQSGALMGSMLARGVDVGAGFSSLISLGNQSDVDLNECFEYLIEDPDTHVICLYIEALKVPLGFRALLVRAHQQGKPVVVCKSGRSAAGERAVQSHTASMAGAYESFVAICRAHGAYLFHNVSDMLDAAMLLERGNRLVGNQVAVFSGSGGAGALLVDALDQAGFDNPSLSEATLEQLKDVLPASNLQSPIDFGTLKPLSAPHPMGTDAWEVALATTLVDANVSAALVLLTSQPNMAQVAQSVARVGTRTNKPLLYVHVAGSIGEQARQTLRDAGYGFVESQNDALAVLAGLHQQSLTPVSHDVWIPNKSATESHRAATQYLTEPQARELLSNAGIPVSPWTVAHDIDQAVDALRRFDAPCVVKAVSPTLIHKSDAGAVKLNIATAQDMRAACQAIGDSLAELGHALDGYLVTPMLRADAELIVGMQRDPAFGPMVVLGAGGTWVELLKDVQMLPAPISKAQAMAMIRQLRCLPLLQGWRGKTPADLGQLADLVVAVSDLAINTEGLAELDINPLMLVDGKFWGADARAVMHD